MSEHKHSGGPVLIATLEYPPQHGGIATYMDALAHALPHAQVEVIAPRHPHARVHDVADSVAIYRRTLQFSLMRPRWFAALFSVWAHIRRSRPGVLVITQLLPMGTVARWMKRLTGTPYVVVVHGMDIALALEHGFTKRAEAIASLRDADIVVANSQFTALMVEKAGIERSKTMVVYPAPSMVIGSDAYNRMDAKRTRENVGAVEGFMFLAAGRLVERKGFDTAIQALAQLKRRGVKAWLVVAGEGPYRRRLEEIAREEHVLEEVRFLGAVSRDELTALNYAADCFVMAPRQIGADVEGFGIVYLDAAMASRPSIATRTGGVPEAVVDGETGILVEPGNPGALADAMASLVANPALAVKLGMQAHARVHRDFRADTLFAPLVEKLRKYTGA